MSEYENEMRAWLTTASKLLKDAQEKASDFGIDLRTLEEFQELKENVEDIPWTSSSVGC